MGRRQRPFPAGGSWGQLSGLQGEEWSSSPLGRVIPCGFCPLQWGGVGVSSGGRSKGLMVWSDGLWPGPCGPLGCDLCAGS